MKEALVWFQLGAMGFAVVAPAIYLAQVFYSEWRNYQKGKRDKL